MSRQGTPRSHLRPLASQPSDGTAEVGPTAENQSADRPVKAAKLARKIALIDPKPLTRYATSEMLAAALPRYQVVAAATCGELLANQEGPANRPRLVIVNVRCAGLADGGARQSVQVLKQQLPDASVIALSDRDDAEDVVDALALGLRGYIPTSTDPEVAFAAVRLVDAGGTFIPPNALNASSARPESGAEITSLNGRDIAAHALDLTPREVSVVNLLREGKPNKLIALDLRMQESTVKVHVRSIMKKLKVANRTQAAFLVNRIVDRSAAPGVTPAPTTRESPQSVLVSLRRARREDN